MKRVVIIGAGYGGLKLFETLANHGGFEVVLFDIHPYHYLQTEIYKFIANKNRFTDVAIDLHGRLYRSTNRPLWRRNALLRILFPPVRELISGKSNLLADHADGRAVAESMQDLFVRRAHPNSSL